MLSDEDDCTEELGDTELRLIYIPDLDKDLLRVLKDTGKGITLLDGNEDYDPPDRSCNRSGFLGTGGRGLGTIALLALSSGLLMSSSFIWLNERMELHEPSASMNKVVQELLARHPANILEIASAGIFHLPFFKLTASTPNGIIFAFFLLGTAGLTGTTAKWMRTQNRARLALGLTLSGATASWMLGFSAEEVVVVCLPLIIGCSILCSSVLGWREIVSMHQGEKVQSSVV